MLCMEKVYAEKAGAALGRPFFLTYKGSYFFGHNCLIKE